MQQEDYQNGVLEMQPHIGKRRVYTDPASGEIIQATIMAIDVDPEKANPYLVEMIATDGRRITGSYKDTEDEPALAPAAPVQPAPAPVAPARSMTIADTQASDILDPNTYIQMKALSNDFFNSNALPASYQNVMQVLMALQAGREMGMQPIEALQSLAMVNGGISVWGKAVTKRLTIHGWAPSYEEGTPDGADEREQYCKATITHADGRTYTDVATFGEAIDSGYTRDKNNNLKVGWRKGLNRRLKLRYDALDLLIKSYVPEVYGPASGMAEILMDSPGDENATNTPSMRDKISAARSEVTLDTKAKAKTYDNTPEATTDAQPVPNAQ